MPLDISIKKVMVIGSGPIVIGQAAEFDYAGTQACRSLKEEGIQVVLVNSNPATIMTDENTADSVYIEPLTIDIIEKIISAEKPDAILPTLGGQTGLNLAMELDEAGILDKYGVKLIGADVETIKKSEDRELFKTTMLEIGEPVTKSITVTNIEDALLFSKEAGFPLIVRPAFTLGGSGGGIAYNQEDLRATVSRGLDYSMVGQVLVEQSLLGWKEIEYEVMRDSNDNCITICNMENIDPVGVHTGDSIVTAPSQTLTDKEYQMLRSSAIKIIRSLKIAGGCNVQFALDCSSMRYYIIEVNPRVSRSSALASKATGYPIARIAAKIAIGYTLDEIKNPITGTTACFEPALDYIVVKIPRWPFDKFKTIDRTLSTQMKATGEVMAIDRSFEAAFMKAVRSLELSSVKIFSDHMDEITDDELLEVLRKPSDSRLWQIFEALKRNVKVELIVNATNINIWFLEKLKNIVDVGLRLKGEALTKESLTAAKKIGFSDGEIGKIVGLSEAQIRLEKKNMGISPVYKAVDTCAAEFESETSYFYSCYDAEDEVITGKKDSIMVLGSGPIRIGQGIEFDYCAVHSSQALKKLGYEAIIVNNNPETVSTDFDTSDRLYFEPLYVDDVMNIIEKEKPKGIIVQFGGQTAINVAKKISKYGVKILGTDFGCIDLAEDRGKFDELLENLGIKRPQGISASNEAEALTEVCNIGFPALVRPSYVIGGQSMRIVYSEEELKEYIKSVSISSDRPLLVDKYIEGKEVEVDAVCDGESVLIPGIMEHVESSGVHSGDSMSVFPSYTLSEDMKKRVAETTEKIAIALKTKGLLNIQYIIKGDEIYVIEANPRASRTIPIISKVARIPMVEVATRVIMGETLHSMGYKDKYVEIKGVYAVKAPTFSFEKISDVDIVLGPEMKSTGEVMGMDTNYEDALYKAFKASGYNVPENGNILITVAQHGLGKLQGFLEKLNNTCFSIDIVTPQAYEENDEASDKIIEDIKKHKYCFVISLDAESYKIRKTCIENRVNVFTSMDTAKAFLECILYENKRNMLTVKALKDYRELI